MSRPVFSFADRRVKLALEKATIQTFGESRPRKLSGQPWQARAKRNEARGVLPPLNSQHAGDNPDEQAPYC